MRNFAIILSLALVVLAMVVAPAQEPPDAAPATNTANSPEASANASERRAADNRGLSVENDPEEADVPVYGVRFLVDGEPAPVVWSPAGRGTFAFAYQLVVHPATFTRFRVEFVLERRDAPGRAGIPLEITRHELAGRRPVVRHTDSIPVAHEGHYVGYLVVEPLEPTSESMASSQQARSEPLAFEARIEWRTRLEPPTVATIHWDTVQPEGAADPVHRATMTFAASRTGELTPLASAGVKHRWRIDDRLQLPRPYRVLRHGEAEWTRAARAPATESSVSATVALPAAGYPVRVSLVAHWSEAPDGVGGAEFLVDCVLTRPDTVPRESRSIWVVNENRASVELRWRIEPLRED